MLWQFDNAHSGIQFTVRHLMISNVRGSFEKFSGTVEFDEKDAGYSKIDVTIDPASINTHDERRDGHLQSPAFFDVVSNPIIHFISTQIITQSTHTGRLVGALTMHGVTHEVTLEVEYAGTTKSPFSGLMAAGFSAHGKLSRKDWGLNWNVALETGGVVASDEVNISIEVELNPVPETAAATTV